MAGRELARLAADLQHHRGARAVGGGDVRQPVAIEVPDRDPERLSERCIGGRGEQRPGVRRILQQHRDAAAGGRCETGDHHVGLAVAVQITDRDIERSARGLIAGRREEAAARVLQQDRHPGDAGAIGSRPKVGHDQVRPSVAVHVRDLHRLRSRAGREADRTHERAPLRGELVEHQHDAVVAAAVIAGGDDIGGAVAIEIGNRDRGRGQSRRHRHRRGELPGFAASW